jgi:hypothetical protein
MSLASGQPAAERCILPAQARGVTGLVEQVPRRPGPARTTTCPPPITVRNKNFVSQRKIADLELARIGAICGVSACREVKQAQVP